MKKRTTGVKAARDAQLFAEGLYAELKTAHDKLQSDLSVAVNENRAQLRHIFELTGKQTLAERQCAELRELLRLERLKAAGSRKLIAVLASNARDTLATFIPEPAAETDGAK